MTSTTGMLQRSLILSPAHSPMTTEPSPEKMPFNKTISSGSFDDNFRVQLFSNPQHTAARRTNSDPYEKRRADISSKESMPQDKVIKKMPDHNRALIVSLKTIKAMIAVATISKLLSKETLAAEVDIRPNIRQIGAAISSKIIATVYGNSAMVKVLSLLSVFLIFRKRKIIAIPTPAPIYRNPAISVGGM